MSPRIRMSLQSNTQDANASVNVVNQVLEITGILLSSDTSTILIKAAAAQHITKNLVIFHCLI